MLSENYIIIPKIPLINKSPNFRSIKPQQNLIIRKRQGINTFYFQLYPPKQCEYLKEREGREDPGFGNWKENKVQTAPSFRRTAASLRPHSQSSAESRERLGRAVLHGRDYISQHAVGRDAIGLSRGGGEATSRREGALRA